MQTSENLVVSGKLFPFDESTCVLTMLHKAPTGGGKTVLFELALIEMVMSSGGNLTAKKCIYMAPTKVSTIGTFDMMVF